MEAIPRVILVCQDEEGREPFTEWLRGLTYQREPEFVYESIVSKRETSAMLSRLEREFPR